MKRLFTLTAVAVVFGCGYGEPDDAVIDDHLEPLSGR